MKKSLYLTNKRIVTETFDQLSPSFLTLLFFGICNGVPRHIAHFKFDHTVVTEISRQSFRQQLTTAFCGKGRHT